VCAGRKTASMEDEQQFQGDHDSFNGRHACMGAVRWV
jgi:hypothetical protein